MAGGEEFVKFCHELLDTLEHFLAKVNTLQLDEGGDLRSSVDSIKKSIVRIVKEDKSVSKKCNGTKWFSIGETYDDPNIM